MDFPEIVARLRAAGCVFAEDEARLLVESSAPDGRDDTCAAPGAEHLDTLVTRRAAGEPLEYLLGWAEFAGLRIAVTDGVFVPRRRTEFLAQTAVEFARAVRNRPRGRVGPSGSRERPVVLDLCAGAGAIAALIAAELGYDVELAAAELDPFAVTCARRTLPARVPVFESDLFAAVPTDLLGRVDVVVANVPYVPTGQISLMPPEAREHERRAALDGGDDGLDLARRVAGEVPRWLRSGGHLLIETSSAQAAAAVEMFELAGLRGSVRESTEFYATVIVGRVP